VASADVLRTYYVNSEGAAFIRVEPFTEVEVLASTQAPDGTLLQDFETFATRRFDELPNRETLERRVREMGETLAARRDAARARLDFARKPARWHVERVARQAIAARDAGQNVVWLADRPHETAAALARLGARAEFVPGAEPFSAAVARAEDG